ncbi:hypothetical protein AWZ03_008581 [Drosophila navojoa]|uniref:Uncharacterized protein n=1 Tax=Drosophila navojoa TaxID=7232 RepID=A0A484BAI3_DRONA|nr:hypothetical protein AWZ03_008581 [Drosophila navojoa]
MIFSIHRYRVAGGTWFLNGDYFLLVVISGALSVIGGVIMLIAIFKGMKWLHVLGLILSWFLPVFIGFFIYPLVVHIIFTICVARYYKEMSNQRFPY